MKRKIFFAVAFILIVAVFSSCEKNCKTCKQVTYIDEVFDHAGNPQEYCGADLLVIEAEDDIEYLNTRTTWECD
jgi:hypothetical protein